MHSKITVLITVPPRSMNRIKYTCLSKLGVPNEVLHIYFIELYKQISYLELDYPGFSNWYFTKVIEGIATGKREIITVTNNKNIVGFSILKNEVIEKKICTLKIFDNYQQSGLGKELLALSLQQLNFDRPLITVPEKHITKYLNLLSYFRFELSDVKQDYYNLGQKEFVFNGIL